MISLPITIAILVILMNQQMAPAQILMEMMMFGALLILAAVACLAMVAWRLFARWHDRHWARRPPPLPEAVFIRPPSMCSIAARNVENLYKNKISRGEILNRDDLVLVVSPSFAYDKLTAADWCGVSAEDIIRKSFPNISIRVDPSQKWLDIVPKGSAHQ